MLSGEPLHNRLMAPSLSAWGTRLAERRVRALSNLPPLTLVKGHSPSHEQKCLTFANRLRSVPDSATTSADAPWS